MQSIDVAAMAAIAAIMVGLVAWLNARNVEGLKAEFATATERLRHQLATDLVRHQVRLPKEAEVAAEVLATTLEFIRALHRMSNPYRTTGEEVADVEVRWRGLAPEEERFRAALARATVHLPDEVAARLSSVLDVRTDMYVRQWAWGAAMNDRGG